MRWVATLTPAEMCQGWEVLLASLKAGGNVLAAAATLLAATIAWLVKSTVTGATWLYGRFLQRIEVMRAIRAEMLANLESEQLYADPQRKAKILAQMIAQPADAPDLTPYVAVYEGQPVFDEIRKELRRLPASVIDLVVTYYNNSGGLTAQLKDLRSEAFNSLDRDRKGRVVSAIYDIAGKETVTSGKAATRKLDIVIALSQGQDLFARALVVVALALAVVEIPPVISTSLATVRTVAGSVSACTPPPSTAP